MLGTCVHIKVAKYVNRVRTVFLSGWRRHESFHVLMYKCSVSSHISLCTLYNVKTHYIYNEKISSHLFDDVA